MTKYEFVEDKDKVEFVPIPSADIDIGHHFYPQYGFDKGLWKAIIKQIKKELVKGGKKNG